MKCMEFKKIEIKIHKYIKISRYIESRYVLHKTEIVSILVGCTPEN